MFYNSNMNPLTRLNLLSSQTSFEPDLDGTAKPACFTPRQAESVFVHPARLPGGRTIKLLKTLLSSACERDCLYCPFRAGRDFRRATFRPDEFAGLFASLHRAGAAEGLFLSSGLAGGGPRTQDRLLNTALILREKHGFRGYLHLKLMPGAEKDQVLQAMRLADRVSVNLEAPNRERLARLAPHKKFMDELLQPLKWAEQIRRTQDPRRGWNGRWPSSVTQFVAGGAGESDLELLAATAWLTRHAGLKRAYFSAFHPVADTPLENQPPTPPEREQRLYQASFLLRDYGFDLEELPFDPSGSLPLDRDPKRAWAERHLGNALLELNTADRERLLRVPGIGPKGARAILQARRSRKLRDPATLRRLGVDARRAAPFILLDGKAIPAQLSLFQDLGWPDLQ
jgi:predicted DNA-binding helix-hairpin-helix protein